ncbi:MAG TPA: arylesterase, partial [Longimicrobiaceae bacterium]|nr:arylesterase [Longimicrobiaceae bacterium]
MKSFSAGGMALAGWLAALMIGCDAGERNGAAAVPDGARGDSPAADRGAVTDLSPRNETGVVLFVGTSLTAGLGVAEAQSFPLLIGQKIDSAGLPFRVVNAGVSGETSAGALSRLDWVLRQPFDVVVLETGANDMLRGQPPRAIEENIQAIIDRVRERRPEARIVLAGMLAAPNLGPRYVREFEAIYPRLAERNDLTLIPFLLEGVAAVPVLNQGDGIHPNPEGH